MYVMEHGRIEISKSALSRLRVSMADTMRATMPLVRHNHGSIERTYLQFSRETYLDDTYLCLPGKGTWHHPPLVSKLRGNRSSEDFTMAYEAPYFCQYCHRGFIVNHAFWQIAASLNGYSPNSSGDPARERLRAE
jgi:hypothetical protein